MPKIITTDKFVDNAHKVHGNIYDYSFVEYKSSHNKVEIVCKEHGSFWQKPCDHSNGQGCKKCASIKFSEKYRKTTEEFIEDAKKVHKDTYDYLSVDYKGGNKKIIISCKIHGEFNQQPAAHLRGQGCPKCAKIKNNNCITKTTGQFTEKANTVHKDKYDYIKVKYVNAKTKVIIGCHIHGDFEQQPSNHLNGNGCPKCASEFVSKLNSNNPTSWSHTDWQKAGERSKNFDSFKVYIIKCWNDDEEFYKIGKTYLKLKKRFIKSNIPYQYKVFKIFEGEAEEISKLEKQLQKESRENKYIPKISFGGKYECFKQIK